jgi:hypothetical protein
MADTRRSVIRFGLAAAVAAGCFVLVQTSALASFDPYARGSIGYDYSYLQCGVAAPHGAFGIVGVNAGYPFTYYNSCLGAEFASAANTGNAALYVNTGYDPSYTAIDGRHTTQACADQSITIQATPAQQAAWAVGCSEADRDLAYATSQSVSAPTTWWLDVETSNSWSTTDLSLNRFTIEGLVDRLRAGTPAPVGVYSTAAQWQSLMGGFQPQVDADWVATGQGNARRAARVCSSAGFTGAPVWLVQYVSGYDRDYAC